MSTKSGQAQQLGNALAGETPFRRWSAGHGQTRPPGNGVAQTRACPNRVLERGGNVERTEDPLGQTGWQVVDSPTKSSTTQKGLTSGKRYWFRVSTNGSAGPGPASDPTTKVAP